MSSTFYPAANGDDGYVNHFDNSITSTGTTVIAGDGDGDTYGFWIRFPNITIEQGATITAVAVRIYNKIDNIGAVIGIGNFADSDNEAAPTTYAGFQAISVVAPAEGDGYGCEFTTSYAADTFLEWGADGLEYYLNAVINRVGWASGNAVLFRWTYYSGDTNYPKAFESFDASGGHPAELVVTYTGAPQYKTASDGAILSDSATAYSLTGQAVDGATISDEATAYSLTGQAPDTAVITDSATAYSLTGQAPDTAVLTDAATAYKEAYRTASDGATLSDAATAFNWSAWLRLYGEIALRRYYCVLTGAADSTTDVTLPMSSFQCRKRQSEPNYLQVYVPGTDYAADIAARPNGDLRVDMAYILDGVEVYRETIIEVDLETIRPDKGAESYTTSLDGHRTTTYGAKNSAMTGIAYRSVNGGKVTLRSATVDFFLSPGDTITYSTDSYTAGLVTITVNTEGETMEVQEA